MLSVQRTVVSVIQGARGLGATELCPCEVSLESGGGWRRVRWDPGGRAQEQTEGPSGWPPGCWLPRGGSLSCREVAWVRPGRAEERAAGGWAQDCLPLVPAAPGSMLGSAGEVLVISNGLPDARGYRDLPCDLCLLLVPLGNSQR